MARLYDVFLIENVPEYKEEIPARELGPEFSTKSVVLDPRVFGLPTARSRRYVIAWRKSAVHWRTEVKLEEVLEALTAHLVADAGIFFWQDHPEANLSAAQAGCETIQSSW